MAKQTFTTGQVLTAQEMTDLQKNDYNQTVSAKVASYVLVASDAGTRITMSNVAATTITVDTALFTAGDTLTITNIGAGVCTITAGTATVSTAGSLALQQYDSGTLYFTSTGVSIWNGANPGDITGVTAGNGLSGGGTSGTVSVAIDTAITVDKTTAQTLTNKTLTSPALTTPTISTATTNGDLLYGTGSGALTRLGIGSSAQVLTVASGVPSWATPSAGMTNPLTTTGDTIYSSSGTTPARLGIGSTGQVLTVAGGIPSWATTSATAESFTLLNSGGTALSGTTTTISGISGKGTLYVMVVGGSTTGSGSSFEMRLNGDSTTKYGWCGTRYQFAAAYSTNNFDSTNSMLDTTFRLGLMANNAASEFNGGAVIRGCNSTSNKMYQTFGNGTPGGSNSQLAYETIGFYSGTSTVSSVSIVMGGTADAGTVYVYASA